MRCTKKEILEHFASGDIEKQVIVLEELVQHQEQIDKEIVQKILAVFSGSPHRLFVAERLVALKSFFEEPLKKLLQETKNHEVKILSAMLLERHYGSGSYLALFYEEVKNRGEYSSLAIELLKKDETLRKLLEKNVEFLFEKFEKFEKFKKEQKISEVEIGVFCSCYQQLKISYGQEQKKRFLAVFFNSIELEGNKDYFEKMASGDFPELTTIDQEKLEVFLSSSVLKKLQQHSVKETKDKFEQSWFFWVDGKIYVLQKQKEKLLFFYEKGELSLLIKQLVV